MSPEIFARRKGAEGAQPGPSSAGFLCLLGLAGFLAGCRDDMNDQPRHEPLEASSFFADGAASRRPVPGTIARGDRRGDQAFYSGVDPASGFVAQSPFPIDKELLERGRERYDIYCSPCHSRVGDGRGMIVLRGFKQPPQLHSERLRGQPIGYFVDVITNGFGVMPSYAPQIEPRDRWAIAAYIGALQLSQYARAADLPKGDAAKLEALAAPGAAPAGGAQ